MKRWTVLLLFFFQSGIAQLPQYDWSSLKNLTTVDGLPSNYTDVLLQDSRGFIWFLTYNGIVRYDGITMKKYLPDINDSNSFSSDWGYDMTEDKEGNIWIACGNTGIYMLNTVSDKMIHYHHLPNNTNSIANDGISDFETDAVGNLWISTNGGLSSYDIKTKKFNSFYHKSGDSTSISHNYVWRMCKDDNENLWLATSVGFDCFNTVTGKVIMHITDPTIINLEIKKDNPLLVFKGNKHTIWLVCQNTGAFKYDIDENKILMHFSSDKKNPLSIHANGISQVFEDRHGNIWISNDGLDVYEKASGKMINASLLNPLAGSFSRMIQDKQGKLWMATGLNGITSIDPLHKKFGQIPERNQSIPASAMLTLLDLGNNRFLTTTENGAFIYNTNEKILHYFCFIPTSWHFKCVISKSKN